MKHPRTHQLIELRQESDWILVGAALEPSSLLNETIERIRRDGAPAGWQRVGSWLEVDADMDWAAGQLQVPGGSRIPASKLALTLTGDGAHTVTHAVLSFAAPLQLQLESWTFPTNQITSPLVGFSAVRGISGLLTSGLLQKPLGITPAPNQFFSWASAAAPNHLQFALPLPAAPDMSPLFFKWIQGGNTWLQTNGLGHLAPLPDRPGLAWQGLPVFSPVVAVATEDSVPWLLGSSVTGAPPAATAPTPVYPRPSLEALVAEVQSRSNLVAYSWETTGARAESFYLMSQVSRVARLHPQLPAGAPSAQWIQSVRLRLGNATSWVSLTAPDQLTFQRRSTVGFTAAELHLLSDWMESPDFPGGLYSTRTRRAASAAEFQSK